MRATRQRTAGVGLALAALLMSGCSAPADTLEPELVPVFASDEEAFAAAEVTYRAYVDALNSVVPADPDTFEPIFLMTTGELNADDRKYLSHLHASGVVKSGDADITLMEPVGDATDSETLSLAVCVDVSRVRLTDSDGTSFVSAERVDIQTMTVLLRADGNSPTGFVVADVIGRAGGPACEL